SQEYVFSYVKHNVSIDITINYVLGNVYAKFIFVSDVGPSYISPSFTVSNGVNNYSFVIPDYIGDVSGFLYVYIYKSVDDFECQMYRKIFYTRRITNRTFRSSYSYNCLNNQNNYSFIFNRVLDPIFYTEKYLIYYNSSTINPLITGGNVHFSISSGAGTVTVNTYPYSILYSPSTYSFVIENFNINTSHSVYINRTFLVATNYITYFSFNTSGIQSVEVNLLLNNSILASNTYNVNPSGDTVSDSISYTNFDSGMILHVKFYKNPTCYVECYYYLNNYLLVFDVTTNYYLDNNSDSYKLDVHIQAYNHWNINLDYVYTFYNVSSGGGSLTYSDTSNNTGVSSTSFSLPIGGNECNDVQSFIGTDYYLVNNVINSNIITDQSTYTISYINNDFPSQNLLQVDIYYGSGLIFSFITNVDSSNDLIYYPDLRFYVVSSYQPYYSILDITILPVNSSYTINSADINVNYVQSSNSVNIYNGTVSNNIGNGINFSTCLSDRITGIDYFYLYGDFNISSSNYNQNINLSFCFALNRTISPAANFDLPLCDEYHEDNSIILSHEIKYGLYNCGDYGAYYKYNSFTLHPNNDFTIETNIIATNYFIVHYKVHNGFNPSDYKRYRARIRGYTIPNYNLHFQFVSFQWQYWLINLQRYYSNYLNGTQSTYPPLDNISRSLQIVGPPSSSLNFLDHYDWRGEQVLMFAVEYSLLNNSTPDLLLVVDIIRYDTSNQTECIVSRKSFIYKNPFRNNISITYKNINYDTLGLPISYDIEMQVDLKPNEFYYLFRNSHGIAYGAFCGFQWLITFGTSDPLYRVPPLYEYSYYNYSTSSSTIVYSLSNHPIYANVDHAGHIVEIFKRFNSSVPCNSNNIDMVINRTLIIYSELWLTRIFIIPTEDYIFVFVGSYLLTSETITVIFSDINHTIACAQHGTLYMRPNRYYLNTHNNIDIQRPSFNYYLNINTLEVIKLNVSFNYTRVCSTFSFTRVILNWYNQPSYVLRFIIINLNINIRKLNDTSYNVLVYNQNAGLAGTNIGSQSIINHVIDLYPNNSIIDPFIISYDNRPNTNNTDCTTYGYEIHSRDILSSTTSDLIFLFHLNDPDFVNYFLNTNFVYHGFYLFNFRNDIFPFHFSSNPFNINLTHFPLIIPPISRDTPFYSHFKVKVTTTETSPGNYSILIEFLADYLVNDPSDPAVIGNVTYDNPATYTGILDIYCNGNLIHTVNLTNASSYTYNTNDPCLSPTSSQEK
ncbi:MAG: hypothetical protein QXF12_06650, partial [Candidatus Aenigmatarchaeota archaeon]